MAIKCEIKGKVENNGKTYYLVKGSDNKEYIFRKYGETDFEIADYEKYKKLFENNSRLAQVAKSIVMPLLLAGALSATTMGCKKVDNQNQVNVVYAKDITDDVTNKLFEYGKERKVATSSLLAGGYDVYELGINKDNELEADYKFVDSDNVLGVLTCGRCISKGFEDYETYEKTGVKTTDRTINQLGYITLTSMVGVNSLEELKILNTPMLIEKLRELGFSDPFGMIYYMDQVVGTNYDLNCEWDNEPRKCDLTKVYLDIFKEYVMILKEQGKTKEDIEMILTDILNNIKTRVELNTLDGSILVSENKGLNFVSLTEIDNSLNELNKTKVNIK